MKSVVYGLGILLFLAWFDPYFDAMSRGNSQYDDQNYVEADSAFENAEEFAPNSKEQAYIDFNRADAKFKAGDLDGAISLYQKSLNTENSDLQKKSFFNMGNAYKEKGELDAALESYLNALKVDPTYEKAIKNIEALHKQQEEQKKQNEQNKKKGDEQNDKGEEKEDSANKDQNQSGDKGDNENQNSSKKSVPENLEKKLSKEQIENLLKQFQKQPLKRQDGKGRPGGNVLEKQW